MKAQKNAKHTRTSSQQGSQTKKILSFLQMTALWLMLAMPCLYRILVNGEYTTWFIIYSMFIALIPAYLVSLIRNRIGSVLLTTLLMITSGVESFMIIAYCDFIRSGNLMSLLITNTRESSNFAANNGGHLLYVVPVVVLGLLCICLKLYIGGTRYKSPRWLVLGGLVCTAGCFVLSANTPPYNIFTQLGISAKQLISKKMLFDKGNDFTFNATRSENAPNDSIREVYIFGVGESVRWDHTSFSNYERNTTPELKATKGLVSFNNYHSTATLTYYSVPVMISRATSDDFNLHYREKCISQAFKECGFRTYVISTGKLLAHDPDLTRGTDEIIDIRHDSLSLAIIDSITAIHPKTMFIVQMMQSHSYYGNFTPDCDIYHPNLITDGEATEEGYTNAYDNSIVYTDKLIARMLQQLDKPDTQAAFIYASDHGEIPIPHGHRRGNSLTPGDVEYHVPMFLWGNTTWRTNHPDMQAQAEAHHNLPTNADNLFYSCIEMADINLPKSLSCSEWSVLSPTFKAHPRHLLLPDGHSILDTK